MDKVKEKEIKLFREVILPVVEENLIEFGEVWQVEGIEIDALRQMDFAGTDYLYNDKGIRGLAVRIQHDGNDWQSFTLRYWTPASLFNTEYAKKLEAMDSGAFLPEWTIHAYLDKNEEILSIAVVKTKDLLKYCQEGKRKKPQTNKKDGTKFYAIFWDDLQYEGIEVYII